MSKNKRFTKRSNLSRAVQSAVRRIKALRTLLSVLKWSGLSFREMGERLAECEDRRTRNGMPKPFSKAQVHNWTRRRDHKRYACLPVKHHAALATLLTEIARERTKVPLIISVEMNSLLYCGVWVRCEQCNQRVRLDLRRRVWTRCARCQMR